MSLDNAQRGLDSLGLFKRAERIRAIDRNLRDDAMRDALTGEIRQLRDMQKAIKGIADQLYVAMIERCPPKTASVEQPSDPSAAPPVPSPPHPER